MSTPLFWVVVGAVALVEGFIVIAALRVRSDSGFSRGIVGGRKAEAVWTLLPALILVAVVVLSYRALQDDGQGPPAGAVGSSPAASLLVDGTALPGETLDATR